MTPVHSAAVSEANQRRVAGGLADLGIAEGERIVLATGGSTDYVDVVLAATRSGVVPVPLDPRLTPYERDAIVAEVEPRLVIDSPDALAGLVGAANEADLATWPRCRPMHFTSGTTGRPKGVWSGLLTSEHAEALQCEERDLWGFRDDDLDLVVSPVYHSAPLRFAMGTLLAGGSVAVLPRFDAAAFVDAVDTLHPTTAFVVPAHLQRILGHLDETGRTLDTSSFRLLAHAGAPCPEPVRRRTYALFGSDVVWEFYGSTEGQFTACASDEWLQHPGTVGRARPGRVLTVDGDDQLWCAVPPWARFEYWRDPERTAQTWRETSDGPAFTVRDLGRIDAEGFVYLDARRDDLVISGGVNVYPAEVEAALEDVDGLVEIAVYGVADEHWGQRVCAAYVGDVPEQALRARATERLSPPKRPKQYVRVDALPRTATGKVRRREL